MPQSNHYEILNVDRNASQAEIKQAYRRLVKLFHPDVNQKKEDKEQIIRINAAYEVLGDIKSRQSYDRQLHYSFEKNKKKRNERTQTAQQQYNKRRKTRRNADEQVEEWLRFVYQPVNRFVSDILNSWEDQIEKLAADPFDDELLEEFQNYLQDCKEKLKQAQNNFSSLPNPPNLARAAAHFYYTLNQIGDGLGELEYFPLNYDESYLHAGQEMFLIATQLYYEAQDSMGAYK
ncbi:DnaJ-class molecular chaperone with C-terminal Zn finger domain [Rivularia sp. PCC 7116]|uniref:J domain-containing protein n=1 Tax=Rivularia sp. PCC 7116 TaxID=373994 RepID=UPI00029F3C0A|nr:J domain-containing protein [Rivularia sp. PCC 7116]AFY58035.1 DnaJ-class molecular chaperone with C-terminal Zn finger domain [Rivularia sp. PCC 7116]